MVFEYYIIIIVANEKQGHPSIYKHNLSLAQLSKKLYSYE